MNEKFNTKRLLILSVLVIFAVVITNAITWYFMNDAIKVKDQSLNSLEERMEFLEEEALEKIEKETTEKDSREDKDLSSYPNVYENKTYNFEFRYPDTHYVEEKQSDPFHVVIFNSKYKGTTMGVLANGLTVHAKKGSDLKTWLLSEYGNTIIEGTLKEVNVNNLMGYYFKSQGMGGYYYNHVFENSNKTYAYVLSSGDHKDVVDHDKFVESFSITD